MKEGFVRKVLTNVKTTNAKTMLHAQTGKMQAVYDKMIHKVQKFEPKTLQGWREKMLLRDIKYSITLRKEILKSLPICLKL